MEQVSIYLKDKSDKVSLREIREIIKADFLPYIVYYLFHKQIPIAKKLTKEYI